MPQQIDQVTLDGAGNGTIRFLQAPLLQQWDYNRVSVSIDTGVISAVTGGEARMYRGEPTPGNFVAGTRTPWLDTAGFPPGTARLTSPEYFTVQFTNCDPGAVATVTAEFHPL